jgi:CDP-diacylglycerol--serine O-phosphatidyltransferase
MLIFKFHLSQLLTNFGLASACLGIIAAGRGQLQLAVICLLLSGLADLYDGPLARLLKQPPIVKKQGVELDSLTDVVAFAILPLTIFQALGLTSWPHTLTQIFLVWAAITRLSVFNVKVLARGEAMSLPITDYQGLPVTVMAIFTPGFYLLHRVLVPVVFSYLALAGVAVLAGAMIWQFKVPKPRCPLAYLGLTLLALLLLVVVICL